MEQGKRPSTIAQEHHRKASRKYKTAHIEEVRRRDREQKAAARGISDKNRPDNKETYYYRDRSGRRLTDKHGTASFDKSVVREAGDKPISPVEIAASMAVYNDPDNLSNPRIHTEAILNTLTIALRTFTTSVIAAEARKTLAPRAEGETIFRYTNREMSANIAARKRLVANSNGEVKAAK